MSAKTTQRVTRAYAIDILLSEIPTLPNDTLEKLLDALADSGASRRLSTFDNFIVSEFVEPKERA